jgi:UDPglucose 6-dehydrogenase
LKEKNFAIWGLSIKPNTDDMREAPSLVIIDGILKAGGFVKVYDIVAIPETKHLLGDTVSYCETEYDTLQDSCALSVITEWTDFRSPEFDKINAIESYSF